MAQKATEYHVRVSHITTDPRTGPIKPHPIYVPLIFFLYLSLILLRLLDNANRSQANGTEQDNGAFIAA